MSRASLRLYDLLARTPGVRRHYTAKLVLAGFVCVHLPLITLLAFVALTQTSWIAAAPLLVATLGATLAGSLAMGALLHSLLAPVRATHGALQRYARDRRLTELPRHYPDAAGRIMAETGEALEQLDELLRFKNRVLGIVAHDNRNAFASIMLASELLGDAVDGGPMPADRARQVLRSIHGAAKTQLQFTEQLLRQAQADAADFGVDLAPVRVAALVEPVVQMALLTAEEKGVALTSDLGDAADADVETDEAKLQHVLHNLLSNAVKFTPSGGRVTVTATRRGGGVDLVVRDTGIGMPAAQRNAPFEPFSSHVRTGTKGERGHGLGLWIVRAFTERLGIDVEVGGAEGEGTTFRLYVPGVRRGEDGG